MPWYPSAKACPAAIKPTVQCFFPTLYQVLLFDFSSFGEKLFFCLRGYRRAIARSAVQKQPERRARMFLCLPAAEQAANGWRRQPGPTTNRLSPRNRAKRGAKNSRSAERGCSSVHPPPNRRRMGGGSNPAPPPTGYAAQSREARCKNSRSAERCARRRVSERNRRRRHLARR